MFGIGLPEFILIMALALIVVGPDKLPGLAKTVAKQILELKKAANTLKDSLQDELVEEKESLKELTSGLSGINESLVDLASANSEDKAEPPPVEVGDEVENAETVEESVPVVSQQSHEDADPVDGDPPSDGQSEPKEAAPKA